MRAWRRKYQDHVGHLETRLSPARMNSETLKTPFSLNAETVRGPVILSTVPLNASWILWENTIFFEFPNSIWIKIREENRNTIEDEDWNPIDPYGRGRRRKGLLNEWTCVVSGDEKRIQCGVWLFLSVSPLPTWLGGHRNCHQSSPRTNGSDWLVSSAG